MDLNTELNTHTNENYELHRRHVQKLANAVNEYILNHCPDLDPIHCLKLYEAAKGRHSSHKSAYAKANGYERHGHMWKPKENERLMRLFCEQEHSLLEISAEMKRLPKGCLWQLNQLITNMTNQDGVDAVAERLNVPRESVVEIIKTLHSPRN